MPERFSVSVPPVANDNFAGAPFRLQNICRNGVPPRSRTITPMPLTMTFTYGRFQNVEPQYMYKLISVAAIQVVQVVRCTRAHDP